MGRGLYFEIACDTHAVVYELPQKRLNWLWWVPSDGRAFCGRAHLAHLLQCSPAQLHVRAALQRAAAGPCSAGQLAVSPALACTRMRGMLPRRNRRGEALCIRLLGACHAQSAWRRYVSQPEPQLRGHSVTVQADAQQVEDMKAQAGRQWPPALAALMQARSSAVRRLVADLPARCRWCCQQWQDCMPGTSAQAAADWPGRGATRMPACACAPSPDGCPSATRVTGTMKAGQSCAAGCAGVQQHQPQGTSARRLPGLRCEAPSLPAEGTGALMHPMEPTYRSVRAGHREALHQRHL